ncbi:MAG: esterase-like activity of phytase family protein [Kiritimatiellia bacterium]|jgi:hypothetical protein
MSGIAWAGGDLFYAVDDTDKMLYPVTININRSTGSFAQSDIAIGTGVLTAGGHDLEGCAFDPASGALWISDETGATIREFDVLTGELLRSAPVPSVMTQCRGNYSLEALTISGDGRTMWTANEEALPCDGDLSTKTTGSTVRLTKFTRGSVRDNWTAAGQWAYVTEPVGTDPCVYNGETLTRSGVSALAALPDGTLLVLERTCYKSGMFPPVYFRIGIYQVNFAGATEVSGHASLTNAPYTATQKSLLIGKNYSTFLNYEGMCLGPRLDDGSSLLVLVSDGGSSALQMIGSVKLSGLDVRTLKVEGSATSEPIGGPYRHVGGSSVTVTQPLPRHDRRRADP